MQLTVTPEQAQRVAAQMQALQATLELLTLGTPCHGLALKTINTDDGTLTFHAAAP